MSAIPPRAGANDAAVRVASAWVLRGGVILSVAVMLAGFAMSVRTGLPSVERMTHDAFDGRITGVWDGIVHGRGESVMEAGVYLLVLTPFVRVLTAMVLFALHERDRLYAAVTALVLVLMVIGFVVLR